MKRYLFLAILLLANNVLRGQSLNVLTGLHPRPQVSYLYSSSGRFVVQRGIPIVVSDTASGGTLRAVHYLERGLKTIIGDTLPVLPYSHYISELDTIALFIGEKGTSFLQRVWPDSVMKAEGYVLDVTSPEIMLIGDDTNGTFNAVSTLLQLVKMNDTVPALHINDWPDYPVRWVFSMHNLQVDQSIHDLMTIEDTMAAHKLNGLNQADFKYGVLDIVAPWYFTDVDTLHKHSDSTNVEIIPSVFGGQTMMWHDPDLAEGFPTASKYRIEGDSGRLLSDPRMQLSNGGFENVSNGQFAGWGYYDNPNLGIFVDSTPANVHSGKYSARCTNFTDTTPRARFIKTLTCDSNTSYHMSVWVKTQGFQQGYAGSFQLLAIGSDATTTRGLTATNYDVPATSNQWMKYDVVFNTLGYTSVSVYVGVWDGTGGTIWFDDFKVEDAGMTNLLRRKTTMPTVTLLDGSKRYTEGTDYQPLVDSIMEQSHGSYPWHTSPSFKLAAGSSMRQGDTVRVRFDRTMTVLNYQDGDGYQFPCLSEDTLYSIFHRQIGEVDSLHHAKQYFLTHDEWRVMAWDSACTRRHLTAGEILADNLSRCDSIIKVVRPGAQTYVWSDMFDSLHNAHNNYYLVNGDLTGDWNKIPKNITIVNWNGTYMSQSLDFFAKHGFSQITSPYYDVQNTDNMRAWRLAMDTIPNMRGMMYTTWAADYSFLTPFADYAWSAGPMIVHEPVVPAIGGSGLFKTIGAKVFADPYNSKDTIVKVIFKFYSSLNGELVSSTVYSWNTKDSTYYGSIGYYPAPTEVVTYVIETTNLEGITRQTPHYLIRVPVPVDDVPFAASDSLIQLYPSPAQDLLHVSTTENANYSFEIVNALGIVVQSRIVREKEGQLTLDTHSLPAGVYNLILNTGAETIAKPFVIVR